MQPLLPQTVEPGVGRQQPPGDHLGSQAVASEVLAASELGLAVSAVQLVQGRLLRYCLLSSGRAALSTT